MNLKELEQDFSCYIKSFIIDGEEGMASRHDPNDKNMFYETYVMFNDMNKDIDKKEKLFGIRSDDDFYTTAQFPYKYRLLSMEYIAKTLYPNTEIECTPEARTVDREKWLAAREVNSFIEAYNWEELDHRQVSDSSTLLDRIMHSKYVRIELLKLIDESHPQYKSIFNYKMKKRKGYLKRLRKIENIRKDARFLGKRPIFAIRGAQIPELRRQLIAIKASHRKSEYRHLDRPMTEVEIKENARLGIFPVHVDRKDYDYAKYVYGDYNIKVI